MSLRKALLILCCPLFLADNASASDGIRRYALAVGANDGGSNRHTLRYAVSDAENFARVMETLGGVYASDLVLLKQPSLIVLEDALENLRHRVDGSSEERSKESEGSGNRTQVMVYYSGHANETGLLLGEEIFSYRSLRNWMDLIEADVRIAVLDACASGTITRLKGTRRRTAFLVDESSEMSGYAFLTSSSADEVAQESDRIGASFFTHYLVSGLRGAADVSGEGRVTLNEAYQFAFNETLGRTTKTEAGAQHPSYDINLSGTGEVVMTDVRETSAILVLSEDLNGRFFIRDANEQLVVELYKPRGRSVELGLEPGTYSVRCEKDSGSSVSAATLEEGGQFVIGHGQFTTASQEPVVLRGGEGLHPRFGGVDGRWRLGAKLGFLVLRRIGLFRQRLHLGHTQPYRWGPRLLLAQRELVGRFHRLVGSPVSGAGRKSDTGRRLHRGFSVWRQKIFPELRWSSFFRQALPVGGGRALFPTRFGAGRQRPSTIRYSRRQRGWRIRLPACTMVHGGNQARI